MSITIESLSAQLNQLQQQRVAAANMAQQCQGAIGVVQQQLQELLNEKNAADVAKAEEELKRQKELEESN